MSRPAEGKRSDRAPGGALPERFAFTIVIPTCDEALYIRRTVRDLLGAFGGEAEIIIVSNGSPESMARVAAESSEFGAVRLLEFPERLGKGGALLKGFASARGSVIGFVDADGEVALAGVRELAARVAAGDCAAAVASKWKGKSWGEVPYRRLAKKILGRGLNLIVRWGLGLPFADTQGGAKFFRRDSFEGLGGDFLCRGFDFDVELLLRLHRSGAAVSEVFIPTDLRETTTFRYAAMLPMLLNIGRLCLRRLAGG